MDTSRLRRATVVPLLLAASLLLAACSGGGDSDSGGATSAGDTMAQDAPVAAEMPAEREAVASDVDTPDRSVIATGVVSLRGDDVGQARFDVQKVVDVHDGEVTEEKTQTDDEGSVSRSRLVVRVPVAEFDATMAELERVAELESSSRDAEDVTTEVIDTEVRIRAQSESLKRVELLLARAQSIRDIVAIEAQLTRRQAELDSLKSRQAYLADQTSMSTITVFLERKPEASEEDEEARGFLAGLDSGWDGLRAFLGGAATLVGVLLPFALLVLVLGVPVWLVLRLAARRRPSSQRG